MIADIKARAPRMLDPLLGQHPLQKYVCAPTLAQSREIRPTQSNSRHAPAPDTGVAPTGFSPNRSTTAKPLLAYAPHEAGNSSATHPR